MTPAEYKAAGYEMSGQLEQAIITKAEADVKAWYIAKILPNYSETDDDVKAAVMSLAYLHMCKNGGIKLTRAGAKTKTTPSSQEPSATSILEHMAAECHARLNVLRGKTGATTDSIVDVLRIYYVTNYFYE